MTTVEIEIDAATLAQRLAHAEPTVLLDVREPWEHQMAALPGGILVPLGELSGRSGALQVPPDALVVTYCHHGVRSLQAARWLRSAGWPQVVSLAGGIDAWACTVDPQLPRY